MMQGIPVRQIYWVPVLLGLLWGCSSDEGKHPYTVAQHWHGWEVRVESRPTPPQAGMNEVLVVVTGNYDHLVAACRVEVRSAKADEWKQAIQDGLVGVYRRAALLGPGERQTLQVRLHCGDDPDLNTVLYFPIALTS